MKISAQSILTLSLLSLTGVSASVATLTPTAAYANAERTGTFVESVSANPTSLFPLTDNDGEASAVQNMFFESLADRHWDTFDWLPSLASKWEISKDGKQFTFTLNKSAKFSDGTPVTAEDVKFSYDVIFMKGVMTAHLRPYYSAIKKVEILSPDKVRFTTGDVYYKNFDVVAGLTVFPKKHYMKLYAKDNSMTKAEATRDPLGSGMWLLEKWDGNQQIIFKRNPNYWNKEELVKTGRWNYDRYIYKVIPEENVEFEMFRKGDLSFKGLIPKQWARQTDGPEFKSKLVKVKTVNKAPVGYSYIGWNQKNPLLASKDVRWALSHVADLNTWINKIEYGMHEPTVGPYSVKSEQHNPSLKAVEFDLDKARARLKAAGWTKAGKGGVLEKDGQRLELTIIYPQQSKETTEPKLVDFKQKAAKVGIAINLKAIDWTTFTKLLDDRKFDGAALGWSRAADGDLKQIWHSDSINNKGSNFISYSNKEVDQLIDQHRMTLDKNKRNELARNLQKIIYEDQPYTFLTERLYTLYAHQKNIKKEKDTYAYTIGQSFWQIQN
ncbi:MAG: peptide ABC transporter substrate-binding protein [Betaproteobacteria bacterium]|nr:peptide ABC transporter substrate-binding protein [Betaproteobacteria bacterium]